MTSLILVITTIVLFVLLIVNLDCIIFTEATVNTSSTTSPPPPPHPIATKFPTFIKSLLIKQPQNVNNSNNNNHSSNNIIADSTKPPEFNQTLTSLDQISGSNKTNTPTTTTTPTISTSAPTPTNSLGSIVLAKLNNIFNKTGAPSGGDVSRTNHTVATTTQDSLLATPSSIATNINNNHISDPIPAVTTTTTTTTPASTKPEQTSMSSANSSDATTQVTTNEPCALPTPDRNTANDTSKYFDIDYAIRAFEESMVDKNAISLHHYLNGFKELMK